MVAAYRSWQSVDQAARPGADRRAANDRALTRRWRIDTRIDTRIDRRTCPASFLAGTGSPAQTTGTPSSCWPRSGSTWCPGFRQSFGTESACCEAVLRARWSTGFVCPRCGGSAHCVVFSLGRPLFQCHACHRQTSLTAGTLFLFGSTKRPLTKWFLAIYLVSQAKTGLSALELKHHIGVSCPTSWLMHHKIMTAMTTRETQHRLSGTGQVADASHLWTSRLWLP